MEKKRNALQKIRTMKELGIFDKWVTNTDNRTRKCGNHTKHCCVQRRNELLTKYEFLSDMIDYSFLFVYTPEGRKFWSDIVEELRSEI